MSSASRKHPASGSLAINLRGKYVRAATIRRLGLASMRHSSIRETCRPELCSQMSATELPESPSMAAPDRLETPIGRPRTSTYFSQPRRMAAESKHLQYVFTMPSVNHLEI